MLRRLPNTPPRYITLRMLASAECVAESGHWQAFRCWSVATMLAWLAEWEYREVATNLYERKSNAA